MAIEITEQYRYYGNDALEPRLNVPTIADRNDIDVNERYNGMKTVVRSPEGKEYQLLYAGNFESLSTAAKNAFLADNNNWTEVVSNASLALKEDKANKGIANGYAPLDDTIRIPEEYLPASLQGALVYKRGWDASTNTAPSATPSNGWTYKVTTPGTTTFTGSSIEWFIGDLITYSDEISNWERFAKIDAVVTVNGDTGIVELDDSNLTHSPAVTIPDWISSIYTAGEATFRAVLDALNIKVGAMDDKLDGIDDEANNYSHPDHGLSGNGDATSDGDGDITIRNGAVTFAKISDDVKAGDGEVSASKFVLANDDRLNGLQEIANDSITNAMLANMPANTVKMAISAGDPINGTKAQLLTLLNVEDGATADQTAAEIVALYLSLKNDYTDPEQAKVANLPSNTNSELAAKQSQIDSLITLVASDDFNLDTVQEIVDFITENRTDLDNYVTVVNGKLDTITSSDGSVTIDLTNPNEPDLSVEIPSTSDLAGLGLTANGDQIDLGGTIGSGQSVQLVANNGEILYVAQGASGVVNYYLVSGGKINYNFVDGSGEVVYGSGQGVEAKFDNDGLEINRQTSQHYLLHKVSFDQINSLLSLSNGFVANETRTDEKQIIQSDTEFKIIREVETNGAELLDPTTTKTTGIDFTPEGPVLIGEPSPDDNALVRRIDLPSGGTSLTKATQTEAETGTDDSAYMTALKVLQSIATRAGSGLTWNGTTKKINLGGIFANSYVPLMNELKHGTDLDYYERWGMQIHNSGASAYQKAVLLIYDYYDPNGANNSGSFTSYQNFVQAGFNGLFLSAANNFILTIDQQGGSGSAVFNDNRSSKVGFQYSSSFPIVNPAFTDRSMVHKAYVDKTQIGTAITASKTFALTDAGAKKITVANSASAIVLTIPLDSTTNFPIGSTINIRRKGAGSVEIIGASGVTLEGIADGSGDFKIPRYGIASIYKESANLWVVYGALES